MTIDTVLYELNHVSPSKKMLIPERLIGYTTEILFKDV